MFTKIFDYLTLTNEIADEIFPNICGDCYNGDTSFVATLRALVAPRMSKDDKLFLRVEIRTPRESTLKDYSEIDRVKYLADGIGNNTILVCGFNSTSESNRTIAMNAIDESFTRIYNGYVELKDLRAFVAKQANMRFYINEEDRSVAVFVDNLNSRLYHYIQSLTSRLLPWYFKDKPLEDQERELVKSLIQKTATGYERLIKEFANKYDFRSKKIEKMLGGFETAAKKQHLRNVESSLNNIESHIERNVTHYRDLIRQREEKMLEKAGLISQINSSDNKESEISDYFVCNKHLEPVSVNSTQLEFIVSCYLENFDVEMYERISRNFDGYMYQGYNPTNEVFRDERIRKKFMDAIFCDEPLLKIKTCAHYLIDLAGYVEAHSGYHYPPEYADMLPNTHIHRHSCLGNQKPLIEEALRNGDNIGAIEQCVCSAKSINVGESATFPYMLEALFASGAKKIIELPDGTSCTPTEALKWLEAQENKTEVSE